LSESEFNLSSCCSNLNSTGNKPSVSAQVFVERLQITSIINDQINRDSMDRACGTYGREKKWITD